MVQRKRSTRSNPLDKPHSTDEDLFKEDASNCTEENKLSPEEVKFQMTQEQCMPSNLEWNGAEMEARSPMMYNPMVGEDYGTNCWLDQWQHMQGLPPRDEAGHLDSSLIEATNMALAQATAIPEGRVVGVYFDKQRRIWRATWREHGQGKRKTKNFSVDDYGFEEARRMAIQFRLVKLMEASDQAMQEQGMLQQQQQVLPHSSPEYKQSLTATPGSNRKKRRRYSGIDNFAPKLPLWAQPYCTEFPPEEVYPSAIWPPLYGHPAAFIHMEQLRNTQQSWAEPAEGQPEEDRGMLDRTDMVSTVDSMVQEHAHKIYAAEAAAPAPVG